MEVYHEEKREENIVPPEIIDPVNGDEMEEVVFENVFENIKDELMDVDKREPVEMVAEKEVENVVATILSPPLQKRKRNKKKK